MTDSRFKERFSLQSILPARHSPLQLHPTISNPMPLVSPASSYPRTPKRDVSRPPPLNLAATRRAYSHPADIEIQAEPSPLYEEVEVLRAGVGSHGRGHGNEVRPGQIYPALAKAQPERNRSTEVSTPSTLAPQQYDSVLHNVLLTPTYNVPSPAYSEATATSSTISLHPFQTPRRTKRRTLLNRVSSMLPSRLQALDAERGDRHLRSLARLREREEQEMERYREMLLLARSQAAAGVPTPIDVSELKRPKVEWGDSRGSIRSQVPSWHTHGQGGVTSGYGGDFYRAGEKRERMEDGEKKARSKQKRWRIIIACIILALTILIVVLCTTLLTRSSPPTTPTPSGSVDSEISSSASAIASASTTTSASSSTPSASTSASQPQESSRTLQSCLSQFATSAPINALAYPCSDCVPLFESTNNDYLSPLTGANSTGVGAALQFCALREVLELTGAKGNGSVESSLKDGGWGRDASPCGGWQGVSCDDRGRLTSLTLKYPSIPNTLPTSLKNLVALKSLTLIGSGSIPTGTFPNTLMTLQNLSAIDIEQTALTGPLGEETFGKASKLLSLSFVGNKYLGAAMPNLGACQELLILVVTGQGLKDSPIQQLANKLTYLDLSYNSLSGTIPSTAHLTALNTLYLDSNAFTSPPTSSFPSSLQSISLNNNPP